MPLAITPNFLQLTKVGNREVFLNEYELADSNWNKCIPEMSSNMIMETELPMAGFGPIPVWDSDGSNIDYDVPIQGTPVYFTHTDYALGWAVSHKMIREDLYKKTGAELSRAAAISVRNTTEQIVANMYSNGFSASYPGGMDNLCLFTSNHTKLGGGVQSNISATGAALNSTTLTAGLVAFRKFTNHRNQILNLFPTKLICSPDNEYAARQLLFSTWDASANVHTENILKGTIRELIVWPQLTSTTAWFLITDLSQTKLRFFWRERPQYDSWTDNANKAIHSSVNYAHSLGWVTYEGTYGNAGA